MIVSSVLLEGGGGREGEERARELTSRSFFGFVSFLQHRPKKRRKRQEKEDDYDIGDPFIDDSTAAIDAPEYTGVTVQGGFFVHMGAVELKEMEA